MIYKINRILLPTLKYSNKLIKGNQTKRTRSYEYQKRKFSPFARIFLIVTIFKMCLWVFQKSMLQNADNIFIVLFLIIIIIYRKKLKNCRFPFVEILKSLKSKPLRALRFNQIQTTILSEERLPALVELIESANLETICFWNIEVASAVIERLVE